MAETVVVTAATDLELWQAYLRKRWEAVGAFQRYDGEAEFGDTDTTELKQELEAASAAETEAFLAFFGDRRLYDDVCAARAEVKRLEQAPDAAQADGMRRAQELGAARAGYSYLHARYERIQSSLYGQTSAGALAMRTELRAQEDERCAGRQQ